MHEHVENVHYERMVFEAGRWSDDKRIYCSYAQDGKVELLRITHPDADRDDVAAIGAQNRRCFEALQRTERRRREARQAAN
jgi:hypothetical protein